MKNNKRLLCVAAHPDDEVLGCGATVRKFVKDGWQAAVIILSSGISGRFHSDDQQLPQLQEQQQALAEQMKKAAEVCGFSDVHAFDFPDNRMDTVSRMDLAHDIGAVMQDFQPDLVLTHHPGDYNWDHTRVFDAVMMAARHSPGDPSPDEIWAYEVRSSTERGWASRQPFAPNIYIDVTETIDSKAEALACYTGELHDAPHPRSVEGIRALATMRGHEVGIGAAEAFELIRKVQH